MKKIFNLMMAGAVLVAGACTPEENSGNYATFSVSIQLVYPEDSEYGAVEGVQVSVSSTINEATYSGVTDDTGLATVELPAGVYEISATDRRTGSGAAYILSGVVSNVTVTDSWDSSEIVELTMSESRTGQVIIKEFYCGGCPIDGESRVWANDKYVILYNNSEEPADLEGLCIALVYPSSSTSSTNYDYGDDGNLWYAAEGTVPAGQAYWAFGETLELQPGEQVIVALSGAVNHTDTYPNSVNLSGSDIYVTYNSNFTNTTINPVPSDQISTSHWLDGYFYGSTTLFSVERTSPAIFLFSPADGYTPESFLNTTTNYYRDKVSDSYARKMVPEDWVIDGMEVFVKDNTKNKKRLTSAVDAGAVEMTGGLGYTLYRNVDKDATEAIEANEGKIVYGYAGGADGETDPSGIDAEASIANGAVVIYLDTNNSTNDFHQRAKASIKE